MEHEQLVEAVHEFAQFSTATGKMLQNHLQQLQRHESILEQEYKAGVSHHDAIVQLQEHVQTLSQQIQTLQRSVIKILAAMGLPEDVPPPDKIN